MHPGNTHTPLASWAPTAAPIVIRPADAEPAVGSVESGFVCDARVLNVVNGEHFSGAERVQSHLGRCLPTFGVTADFVCVKPGRFAEILRGQNGCWGKGFQAPMRSRFDLRAAWSIAALVRRGRYDVLHAHTPRTAMLASVAARLSGVPWVYHVHSPASRDSSRSVSNQVNATIERLSLRGCAHLITVSESLRMNCVSGGVAEEQVTVVHNGVPAVRPLRLRTPEPEGHWVLGMVALMRPRKGLEVVLNALARLRTKHDLTLRIIGPFESDSYRIGIDDQIERLRIRDLVEFVGFTDDVPEELAKLDAMVLPSLFGEGLPMVVLESMAAGLPVIATRVEGTPEAITDGVEGLLAEPGDAESLAGKMDALVSGQHDWTRMSDAAVARHRKDFSDLAMAQQTARVYQKVLAGARVPA
ncbi:glycosyltransferase family 4 protein [Roseiconus nitratireducens]|uniref:Glycosyltransferase family 4 protein n=1 Tax=Roseiconus nitratireducens TaxID=2605748 RepID=A0A5M6DAP0_9BACT|nr:glycosyltransferase family 4 protein [Roseiconus nitratireducens]KAA5543596.1 glycosyltransferase family 4 protein [Roseiconus nitratireducens]